MTRNLESLDLNLPIEEKRELIKGKIITFEAIDAVGKTTQSGMLLNYFIEKLNMIFDKDVVYYTFPDYNTETGKTIKTYLSNPKLFEGTYYINPEGEQFDYKQYFEILQCNNKMEKLPELMDHIKEGRTIIMNRYIESQYAYGEIEGHNFKWLHELNKYLPKSDIVFLLDLDVREIKQRIMRRNKFNGTIDKYESNIKFLEKVREQYLELYLDFDNWHYIDCNNKPIEWIADEIIIKLFFVLKMIR